MVLEGTSRVQLILTPLLLSDKERISERARSPSRGEPGQRPRVADSHPGTLCKTSRCLLNEPLTPALPWWQSMLPPAACVCTRARTHAHTPNMTPNRPPPPLHGACYALGDIQPMGAQNQHLESGLPKRILQPGDFPKGMDCWLLRCSTK